MVVFGGIIYVLHRQSVVLAVASMLAMFGLIAGDSAPAILDSSLHPLVPVLRSNYWLTIHVLTITLGYAAFALSLGLANITLFQFLKKPKVSKVNSLNQLNYRAIQFGVVFIAAGTILGGIWADYSWGRFWGWYYQSDYRSHSSSGFLAGNRGEEPGECLDSGNQPLNYLSKANKI